MSNYFYHLFFGGYYVGDVWVSSYAPIAPPLPTLVQLSSARSTVNEFELKEVKLKRKFTVYQPVYIQEDIKRDEIMRSYKSNLKTIKEVKLPTLPCKNQSSIWSEIVTLANKKQTL